jgi:hypothetical protein
MSLGYTKGIPIDTDGTLSANRDDIIPSQKAVKTYADTKESSSNKATTMSGNTTSNVLFLTAKAIYDWAVGLFLQIGDPAHRKIYNYQNTDSSITGSTNQTVLANLLIPASSIGENGKLLMFAQLKKTGTAGNFTVRFYLSTDATNTVGTTGTPTNSTLIATRGTGATNLTGGVMSRQMQNKNSESLNEVYPTTVDSGVDTAVSTTAMTTTNINTTVDLYYVITGQLVNSADTGVIANTQLYIDRP